MDRQEEGLNAHLLSPIAFHMETNIERETYIYIYIYHIYTPICSQLSVHIHNILSNILDYCKTRSFPHHIKRNCFFNRRSKRLRQDCPGARQAWRCQYMCKCHQKSIVYGTICIYTHIYRHICIYIYYMYPVAIRGGIISIAYRFPIDCLGWWARHLPQWTIQTELQNFGSRQTSYILVIQ